MISTRRFELDEKDPLKKLSRSLSFPKGAGREGRRLSLREFARGFSRKRPVSTSSAELEDWEKLAVEAHFHGRHPWLPYHELLTGPLAQSRGSEGRRSRGDEFAHGEPASADGLVLSADEGALPKILVEGGAFSFRINTR